MTRAAALSRALGGPALWSLAAAALLVAPNFLMRAERGFYRRHFPGYFASWTNNGAFSPIDTFSMSEDNYYYAARMRQAGSHHWPGDPYIKENRSSRLALADAATFSAFGLIYRVIGDVRRAWVAAQFIFALAWIPCLYALLVRLGAARGQAVFVATGLTLFADLARVAYLGPGALERLRAIPQYLFWFLGSYEYLMGPLRITGPLFTYPCLFLASLAFVRVDQRRGTRAVVLAGLAGGLLAYVHSDVWLAFMGAALLYAAVRSRALRAPAWRPIAALLVAAAASLPWLLVSRSLGSDVELLGLVPGRFFAWGALPFLLGAWAAFRLGEEGIPAWCGCMLLALFAACNAQLITGWSLAQGHWYYHGTLFLALVAGRWLGGRRPKDSAGWLWGAACLILLALPRAISYSALHYQLYGLEAGEQEAFAWLDRNTPPDSVVAALSPETGLRVPVHTHDKILVSYLFPVISDIPAEENARRIIHALSLFGAKLDDYLSLGGDESGRWESRLWTGAVDARSRERSGLFYWHFCNMDRGKVLRLLTQAAREPGPADFEADYLWAGPFEKELMRKARRKAPPGAARKAFENASVTIYELRPAAPAGEGG